jgi:signal transduction histidine kinase
MSAYSGSFRWYVGTADAPREAVIDAVMDHVRPPSTMRLSGMPQSPRCRSTRCATRTKSLQWWAHELRGPLTPLQFATNLIRRASADQAEVLRSVDMIDRQVTQISRLADDLIDAMRVELGALRVSKVPVAIVAVLAAPLAAAALAAALRKQIFTVQISDRSLCVYCDPVRLAQAVNNLLHNALKYTPESGCITVKVLADRNILVLSVKDDGMGI